MKNKEIFSVEPGVCQLMMHILARCNRHVSRQLAPLGLTVQTARVLMHVRLARRARCREIALGCGLEAAALSHILSALLDKHLIERRRLAADGRSVEVWLSQKGEGLTDRCLAIARAQDEAAFAGFAAADAERLRLLLERVATNFRAERSDAKAA